MLLWHENTILGVLLAIFESRTAIHPSHMPIPQDI